jgi:hypothetical protein
MAHCDTIPSRDSEPEVFAPSPRTVQKVGRILSLIVFDLHGVERDRAYRALRRAVIPQLVQEGKTPKEIRTLLNIAAGEVKRAHRPPVERKSRPCEQCGESFTGRADARYCSDTCRQRVHRAKVKATA